LYNYIIRYIISCVQPWSSSMYLVHCSMKSKLGVSMNMVVACKTDRLYEHHIVLHLYWSVHPVYFYSVSTLWHTNRKISNKIVEIISDAKQWQTLDDGVDWIVVTPQPAWTRRLRLKISISISNRTAQGFSSCLRCSTQLYSGIRLGC